MPKDICSVRINRLNTLLLISSSLSAAELMDAAEITSRRQNGIAKVAEWIHEEAKQALDSMK